MPTGQQYTSTAPQTQLVGGINNTQTTATVASFTGWPATPFTGVWDIGTPTQEAVDVTGVAGASITSMTRGVDGTSAQAHSNNATFTHAAIGRDFREMRAHIDASSSNDSAGHVVHGLQAGSSVVGTTDIQTLTNKTLTSPQITGMNTANPNITGTVTGGAQYQNIVAGSTTGTLVPLTVNSQQNPTADLIDVQNFGTTVLWVDSGGSLHNKPTGTGNSSLILDLPAGSTGDITKWMSNGAQQASMSNVGIMTANAFSASGLTGAASASRYVGATAGGPPTTGTFSLGDWVVDRANGIIWTCTTAGSPGTWAASGEAKIATSTLASSASSISFSSIPQYFKHLRLHISATAVAATTQTAVNIQFNNDTGNHYAHALTYQSGSTTLTTAHAGNNADVTVGFAWGNNSTVDSGQMTVEISNYSNTLNTNKAVKSQFVSTDGGVSAWNTGVVQGVWFGTNTPAAITSIQIFLAGGISFAAGTTVDLYAIA